MALAVLALALPPLIAQDGGPEVASSEVGE
jgi:hypothetical protein